MIRSFIAAMALLFGLPPAASAREFIPLWEKGKRIRRRHQKRGSATQTGFGFAAMS